MHTKLDDETPIDLIEEYSKKEFSWSKFIKQTLLVFYLCLSIGTFSAVRIEQYRDIAIIATIGLLASCWAIYDSLERESKPPHNKYDDGSFLM